MKAWVLHDIGQIQLEQVKTPILSKHDVLVKVKAAGICGSDIPRIYQTGAHTMPLIPGHEFAGEVVRVGDACKQNLLGARVGVFPMLPCMNCIACQNGTHELCRNYSYLGSRRDGGFAQYVAVPEQNLLMLPQSVTYEQAAMLEPMAVAVHAMRRVAPVADRTVVVSGLGTIGLLLVMLLKQQGVSKLLAIGNKESQKVALQSLGISAQQYCDTNTGSVPEWVMDKTNGTGADIYFECVGKNETIEQAIALTGPGGRICMVGNPYSDMMISKEIYWKILRNQLVVTGTWNSSFFKAEHWENTDWEYVLQLLAEQKIRPEQLISHRYQLSELEQGFSIMKNKTEDYLKIMMVS